jgi:hypothetical protein
MGAQLGMGVGGLIDPPKGPHVIGPRLSDLTTQTSTYGAVIPRLYGTTAVTGNVFWLENNQLKETATTENQGGKGGGGSDVTTFSYSATFAVGLGRGPMLGVRRIWIGSKLYYDAGSSDPEAVQASNEAAATFAFYPGTETQNPDPRMQAALGVANTPAYRGLCYIVFYDLPLKDWQNSLVGAQVKVELVQSGTTTPAGYDEQDTIKEYTSVWLAATTQHSHSLSELTGLDDATAAQTLVDWRNEGYIADFGPGAQQVTMTSYTVSSTGISVLGYANTDPSEIVGIVTGTFDLGCASGYELMGDGTTTPYYCRSIAPNSYTITPSNVTLASIVSAEALQSNLLAAGDIDVTDLTPEVRGYRVNSVAAIRSALEQPQAAWPFDVIQSGYQVKFQLRGKSSVATIPIDKLDARGAGDQPGVQLTNSREMDSVLPRKVDIKYFDVNREYDTGEQYAERINTDAVNTTNLELAIVFTADEAAQKAEVLLYMYWLERYDLQFKLPPEYQYLEPSDVITITSDDASYELRLTSINYTSDSRLECQAKYNNSAVYTSTAVGQEGASTGQVLRLAGPTIYELLDVPLLQDDFNTAGFPLAMTGTASGWPGGVLYRSTDGGQTWSALAGIAPPGSTIGIASNTLAAHPGTMMDKSGSVSVTFYREAPSSVTELQMLNGANCFAYGVDGRWEIISAQNCVEQPDGSFILTDFLRGRFGTEWASGLHQANDVLVLLNTSSLQFISTNIDSIGIAKTYRGITAGKAIDSAADEAFTYNAVNLKPLSPVYLNGSRDPATGDWSLAWIRRTRVGGAWRDLVDATLGETSEAYEMEIYADGAYATVKRTISASSPTLTYSSAQQTADFGSNQSTLYIRLYQLSATVGRGTPLETSITR